MLFAAPKNPTARGRWSAEAAEPLLDEAPGHHGPPRGKGNRGSQNAAQRGKRRGDFCGFACFFCFLSRPSNCFLALNVF